MRTYAKTAKLPAADAGFWAVDRAMQTHGGFEIRVGAKSGTGGKRG